MPVLENIGRLATGRPDGGPDVLHTIDDAALVWEADTIQWIGSAADLPSRVRNQRTVDAEGHLVVPGLIDGHTHLAFGGWRADEFAMRIQGASYLDIARQGGGIRRTVEQTRRASEDELVRLGMERLDAMAAPGGTTVEAKSGYGLTVEDELKTLRVYRRLQKEHPLTVVPTFLGAHTVPPEYDDDRDGYIDLICNTMIPRVAAATLAEFCDVFVEETAFSPDEARRIFATAHEHGLRPKLHADQLTDTGGAALAAAVDAASADHLEMISDDGIAALYLNQDPLPARRLLDAGVPVAVATDFNPGSAPSYHLPVAMTLACTMQRMTPAEVLTGATRSAAQALDRADRLGTLAPGMQADFVLVDAPSVDHWLYHLRPNAAVATYVQGTRVSS